MEPVKEQAADKYPCPLISLRTPDGIIFTPRMKRDGEGGWTWENPAFVNKMLDRIVPDAQAQTVGKKRAN